MKAHYLGHVVFYVKDLERSLAFYRDLLGFQEVGRVFNGAAAALTSGRTHHELLLIQVGDAPGPPAGPHETFRVDGPRRATDQGSAEEAHQQIQTQIGAGVPLRFSGSLGQSHSGRRFER